MKKGLKILVALIIIIAIIGVIGFIYNKNSKPKSNFVDITSPDELAQIVTKVYEGNEELYSSLQTQTIDISDSEVVKSFTGLENGANIEFMVASEPMMSSQAYSFVLLKLKDGVNADEIAEKIKDNVDERKWICVTAEKVYTTSSDNIVCLVMSNEEMAKPVYEKFKMLAGVVGQEFEKTAEEPEIPEDIVQ